MSPRRAFTLIEVLAASALSALLMLAVLGFAASSVRAQRAFDRAQGEAQDLDVVFRLLERDLTQATRLTIKDPSQPEINSLTLEGFCGLDAKSRDATHRPARVRYEIRELADTSWLLRCQTELSGDSKESTSTELVCPNVSVLRIEDLSTSSGDPVENATAASPAAAGSESSEDDGQAHSDVVPSLVRVSLQHATSNEPISRTIVLR